MIYTISSKSTGQVLKAGTIRLVTYYRDGMEIKGINSKTAQKKMEKVAEIFNINLTDLVFETHKGA